MVITPEFTGTGRSLVIQGSSEFWSQAEAICLDIDRANGFGRDSLFVHNFAFTHFGRPGAILTAIITNSAKF